jgi:hypothetical protein
MTCRRKPIWVLCRIFYALPVSVDIGQQIFTEGKNRRRSMPESSLAEEAAIPPAGHVLAARIPAGHASGVNVTGIPDRRGGQPPAWGMITDANIRADDDPGEAFSRARTPSRSALSHHHASKLLSRKAD